MQLVELAIGDVDVRVAQQRHEIVGVGPHARVLEVDDVEAAVAQHQVAAVIVAMAEHARLGRELVRRSTHHSSASAARSAGDSGRRGTLRRNAARRSRAPRSASRRRTRCGTAEYAVDASSAPRRCSSSMSATAWRYERRVLGRRRRAEVRLQRHVAEILQRQDAERVGVAEDRRHRQRHPAAAAPRRSRTAASRSRSGRRAAPARSTAPSAGMTRKYRRSDASPVSGTTRAPRGGQRRSRVRYCRSIAARRSDRGQSVTGHASVSRAAPRQVAVIAAQHRFAAVRRAGGTRDAVGHDALVDHRVRANLDIVPQNRPRDARRRHRCGYRRP